MDFVPAFFGAVAWPLVVLTLFLVFRRPILELLGAVLERVPEMESLKVSVFQVGWSQATVGDMVKKAEATLPSDEAAPPALDDDKSGRIAERLADVWPSAGVIHSFLDVEREAAYLLESRGVRWRGSPTIAFRKSPLVSPEWKELMQSLASLRNAAAHGRGDVSRQSAQEYIEAAEHFAFTLREARFLWDDES